MEKQTYENKPDGFMGDKNTSQDIYCDSIVGVKRMIIYSAAVGIEKRFGKNVVNVYQHGAKKNEIIPLPVFLVIPIGDNSYENKMEEVMNGSLKHLFS